MKSARMKLLPAFMLIMVMCWALYGITVNGGYWLYLIKDDGDEAGSWTQSINKMVSTPGLGGYDADEDDDVGPSMGYGGDFYYFRHSDGTRELGYAEVTREAYFDESEKQLAALGQLRLYFLMNYRGAYDDRDEFYYRLTWIKKSGARVEAYESDWLSSNGDRWRQTSVDGLVVPADAIGVHVYIWADRNGNGNMNVYLDNINLWVRDNNPPVMTGATVTEIKDKDNAKVDLKKNSSGVYLDNWVNQSDTINGSISFNEPVKEYDSVLRISVALRLNVLNSNDIEHKGIMLNLNRTDYSAVQNFEIPPGAYNMKAGEKGNTIKFYYDPDPNKVEYGPFTYLVDDMGGNHGLSNVTNYNIDKYNLKLDSVVPTIETPSDAYAAYKPGRSDVDIVVNEKDVGIQQSPLTLYYYWIYKDKNGIEKKLENKILISSTIVPVIDEASTTYTAKINIPDDNNTTIPPYQDFQLYVRAQDDARNSSGEYKEYLVRQRDITPPDITWEKSVRDDGTEVNLQTSEDTAYAGSRTVTVSASDAECGVEALYYLWSKEPLDISKESSITKEVIRQGDVFTIPSDKVDFPTEVQYYLNLKAKNATETVGVVSKGFYFDNEAPRVSRLEEVPSMNPSSIQYQVSDVNLQDKLLYTVVAYDSSTSSYETVVEPNISDGIKDNGMWSAVEFGGAGDEEQTASITEFIGKIRQSGKYKLFTRFYDAKNNYTEMVEAFEYDLVPPQLEEVAAGEPSVFKKEHEVLLGVTDNLSGVGEVSYEWIDMSSGEVSSADIAQMQDGKYAIKSNGNLNGKYYLNIKLKDNAGNETEEAISIGGSSEFYFDTSPPSVDLVCDTGKAVRSVRFKYSEPNDTYSGIGTFKYRVSTPQEMVPSDWIEIEAYEGGGEIVYPHEYSADGEWYLSVMLQDTLGNEQIIPWPEPFRVDVTDPSGKIGFESSYTNKLDVFVQLEVDELKEKDLQNFRTILSGDKAVLEDENISAAPLSAWKDVCYEYGTAVCSWKLADTGDGEQKVYARFMDEAGNISGICEAGIVLDRTAPAGEISYDITAPTIQNVTASLIMKDNFEASKVTLLNNNQVSSYVFNCNGEFEFVFMDEAGNKARAKAVVNNIDRMPPKAAVTYSHPRDVWTNESVTATLQLEDANGYTVISDGGSTHIFDENDKFVFLFKDTLGNQGSMKAEVKNIDKALPVGGIIYTYSDTAPVTVYLAVYEPVKVTNNEGSFRYVFNDNAELPFTFTFMDKAGNPGELTVDINTITTKKKYVDVIYSDSGRLTNKNIDAEFTTFSDLAIITSPTVTEEVYGPYTHSFTENGDWPVSIRVLSGAEEGSVRTVAGSVYNIDRVPPEAEVYINTEELTNQNITATLLTYDDRGKTITIENNGGKSEYAFEANGTFTFDFMDEAGNIGHKTITVSNIDKSAPAAEISYYRDASKGSGVYAEITFPGEAEEVEIRNNNGKNTFEFVENGTFTFIYADKAGNIGEATAQVNNISEGISAGTIKYYIGEDELADPNAVNTNKSVTAKLILAEENGPYSIVNNGGSSSYTFDQNGEFTFVYEDSKGNRGFATARISSIDKEAPKLQILANTVKATNEDVIVTVSYSDNKGISKVMLNNEEVGATPEGKSTYTCTENKTISVKVVDTAGNETNGEFIVDYIDKKIPSGTITYTPGSLTNQNVKAILTIDEPGVVLNNNGKFEYVFTENGSFTFEFADNAGNKESLAAAVNWIDKAAPEVTLEYSNTSITNKPVEVTVKANEDIVAVNNGGAVKRTFYVNGEFTFKLMDLAKNEASIKAEVGNIDTTKPQITLKGSKNISIFRNETYDEAGYTASDNIDGDLTEKVTVEGSVDPGVPGTYVVKYKVSDAAGNSSEESRTVKIIGPDELVLLLNGKPADGEWVVLDESNVTASCIGNEGSCIIKLAEGKRTQAYFKSEGNYIAAEGTVKLEPGSWYTFFLQDRERKTKCIQVYINK